MNVAFDHDRVTMREAGGEALWCLRGLLYNLRAPMRRLPACRYGVHEWCSCCSPVSCVRCGKIGHD